MCEGSVAPGERVGAQQQELSLDQSDFQRKPEQMRLAGKLQEWQTALFLPLPVY